MRFISTTDLETYIKEGYSKLRMVAENDGIYDDMRVIFNNKPFNYEGDYAYSDEMGYHYCGIERGVINGHEITDDLFEISYWIYSFATSMMASRYELRHRINNQDFRRLMFKKQLELLELIGANYRKRGEMYIDETLKQAPYDDNNSTR